MLKGYIYNDKGYHSPPIYLENSVENLAEFICRGKFVPTLQIVDESDHELIRTLGDYIDVCHDEDLLRKLIPKLTPIQEKQLNTFTKHIVKFIYEDDANSLSKLEFIEWIKETFNYQL